MILGDWGEGAFSLKEDDEGVDRESRNGEWVNLKDNPVCICCCFHCSHGLCLWFLFLHRFLVFLFFHFLSFGSALNFTFLDLLGFFFVCLGANDKFNLLLFVAIISVLSGLIINKILVKIMFLNRICLKQRLVNQLGSRVC